ncbi:MAG: Imm74 family immunity protein [Bacteroidota bacterium]|nr:Imm74 family immunity protein [Bacteroidota bacterium]
MEILEIQRGRIKLKVDDRTATIEGEGFSRQFLQPGQDESKYVDYVVYPGSLTHWDNPWESELLPAEVKAAVLAFLKKDFKQRGQILAIE